MKNKLIAILILILIISNLFGQKVQMSLENCDEIMRDNFGNFYTLDNTVGSVKKFSSTFKLLNKFNSNSGNQSLFISAKDLNIVNPNVIYLLDEQDMKIIEFDEYLNFIQVIDLPEEFTFPTKFIVLSNRDWLIYDEFQKEIYRVKPGENISQIWGDERVKHFINEKVKMYYYNNFVYLFVEKENILLIINNSGMEKKELQMSKKYKMKRILYGDFENVIFTDNRKIFEWKFAENRIDTIMSQKNVIYIFQNENLIIDSDGNIYNYSNSK
ncbi:MAG: hypothetical protein U9N76_00480 [Candidatus Marinimicrobia bacterium]|nr:hypothetical protein [Candidatus Neomarinimicrobiota bacterium]